MEQVWEIMEVTYALPERALVRNERAIMEHRAVPGGDRMSARERCADLAGRTREAMSYGVLSLWATAENFETCHSKLEELDKGAWDAVGRRQPPVQAPKEFFRWIIDRAAEVDREPPDRQREKGVKMRPAVKLPEPAATRRSGTWRVNVIAGAPAA